MERRKYVPPPPQPPARSADDDGDHRAPRLRPETRSEHIRAAIAGARGSGISATGESSPGYKPTVMFQLPAAGRDLVAAGATIQDALDVNIVITRIIADLDANVTGSLRVDGRTLHSTDDGQGSTGVIEVGDLAAYAGMSARQISVDITNDAAAARNCRYYIIGFVPEAA